MGSWNASVYEWEGDSSQKYGTYDFKSRKYLYPSRIRFSCGRVIFTAGDLTAFNTLLQQREDALKRNRAKIAMGAVDISQGFSFAVYPVAGDELEEVPAVSTYSGSDSIQIKIYADGVLQKTKTIYSDRVFKFRSARAKSWAYELIGNVDVQEVALATSVLELKAGQG